MIKDLTIIIVNYKVKAFLKVCLFSVEKAIRTIDAEVFVVDNASDDGSVEMVKSSFPRFNVIANKENRGFSVANNQAIAKANGKIILLLNPDTIIPEDAFIKLLSFYKDHPDATGVGVKMLDGSGNYLPESKRGLPSSRDFIFKFSGLINVFPRSKIVSGYYMGDLSSDKTWEVPVLAGAFFAFPKKVLESTGPLDEDFFMYGEDIDLSYRLSRLGKNYYYPEIKIIHFKGESTVKDEKYIDRFYGAMLIFTGKHFFPKYNAFHKWMVISSVNVVKRVLKSLLVFSRRKNNGEDVNDVNPVSLFVGCCLKDYERFIKRSGLKDVKFCNSFSDIEIPESNVSLKKNILIDMRSVSVQDMIIFMEKYRDMFTYSFLSSDREFYLRSTNSRTSGKVIYL